ncbi:hypothetical protein DMENIID0001_076660 [Sergentomyia squamirostris]
MRFILLALSVALVLSPSPAEGLLGLLGNVFGKVLAGVGKVNTAFVNLITEASTLVGKTVEDVSGAAIGEVIRVTVVGGKIIVLVRKTTGELVDVVLDSTVKTAQDVTEAIQKALQPATQTVTDTTNAAVDTTQQKANAVVDQAQAA